jgi:hypothetical protein
MQRRTFMRNSVAAATALAIGGRTEAILAQPDTKARVQQTRPLGKTGFQMSDISFGAGRLPSASLVLRAIDQGVNYFDTAPDYGNSEDLIGEALQRFKQRDKVFIVSKFCRPVPYQAGVSHLGLDAKEADYVAAVENSLKRLKTDYLDGVFVHAIGEQGDLETERKRLVHEPMLAAFARLKEAGKVRFLAVSSHGPHNMETLMMEAVRSGHFDWIMPAFNFMNFPKVPEVLQEAKKRQVGVVAMKTLAGAKDMNLDPKGGNFEHAAFKWVLKHTEVSGLVISIKSVQSLDHYLRASGEAFASVDQRLLDRYAAYHGQDYCRTGCGDCEAACPSGIPIATILRHQMYFQDYGDEKRAMRDYAALSVNAAPCETCDTPHCAGACIHGLPVAAKLTAAHRDLVVDFA